MGPLIMAWLGQLTLKDASEGFEAARIAYSWPAWAILLMIVYRNPLSSFLSDVVKIKFGGGGLEFERRFVEVGSERETLRELLGGDDSRNRAALRWWLRETIGWKESEVSWTYSASERDLKRAINFLRD